MMSEHVVEREIKKDFFSDEHISPVTSEPSVRHLTMSMDFYFGIS